MHRLIGPDQGPPRESEREIDVKGKGMMRVHYLEPLTDSQLEASRIQRRLEVCVRVYQCVYVCMYKYTHVFSRMF